MMIFGILVAYSEDYFVKSLQELEKVLKLTVRKHKIIVVFNHHHLAGKLHHFKLSLGIDFDVVKGSNQLHEFSGWSEGLDFVKINYANDYNQSSYIFCNDTFCHHRTYTRFHRLINAVGANLTLISRKPVLAGEIHSVDKQFEFNRTKFNSWVSSYFFAINQYAMKSMDFNVLPDGELISEYLIGGCDEKHFLSNTMDLTLKKHILNNLFHGGWYKSEALNETNKDMFYYKARSILAELNLSSKAHANKLNFIDTYYLNKLMGKLMSNKLRDKIRLMLN